MLDSWTPAELDPEETAAGYVFTLILAEKQEENVLRLYYVQPEEDHTGSSTETPIPEIPETPEPSDPTEESQTGPEFFQEPAVPEEPEAETEATEPVRPEDDGVLEGLLSLSSVFYSAGPADELMPEEDYALALPTAAKATPAGTAVRYIVRVRYEGDNGAQSGRIDVRYALPEGVTFLGGEDSVQVGSPVLDGGTFQGGGEVAEALRVEDGVLTGAVTGLFAGTYMDVSVLCELSQLVGSTKENVTLPDGGKTCFWYWDGIASAQTWDEAVTSKYLRLWYSEADMPPTAWSCPAPW